MMNKQLLGFAVAALIPYYVFYLMFTGAAQYIAAPRIGIQQTVFVLTHVESQLYTGPMLQIIGDGFVVNLRIFPALIGLVISTLVGYNAGLLLLLYMKGLLRACLIGTAWSGVGGLLASIISFGYLCCGWPLSLAFFGIGLMALLSPYLTAVAFLLLAINAYILTKRFHAFEKLKNIKSTDKS
ncbi:MAG: hypothetical protein QXG52_08335 [Candidatus Caldarchaeum sp.]